MAQVKLTPTVSVTETYSDNIDQLPDGQESSAILSDVTPALALRWRSARVTAAADASATFRHQTAGEDKGVEILPGLGGFSTFEVSRDLFFVDASASVSQQLLNTRQNDTSANRDTVQNYSLSPYVVGQFGGFANAELRYTLDQVLTGQDNNAAFAGSTANDLSDATTHTMRATLDSGADFSRLVWSLAASASESSRVDTTDVSRRDVALNVEYPVARWLSVLGGAGYQKFDDGDPVDEVDGPSWDAGILLRPGPRTELRATYGKRYDEQSLDAELTYRIGPRTTFVASYNEKLETGQERILDDLQFISADPTTGVLIDSRTGLPFNPNTSTTGLQDQTTRTKTLNVVLLGTRGRNSFQIQGTAENSKDEGTGSTNLEEDSYTFSVGWQRRLNPKTNLSVFGNYGRNEFTSDNRTDNEFGAGSTLSYVVFTNVDAFASYRFDKKISTDNTVEFMENRVSVGLRMTF